MRMGSAAIDTDVLIVGAGPVGLFLANEYVRLGLRWWLVETRSSQSDRAVDLVIYLEAVDLRVADRTNIL
jgi:2-polyprenyl-6-methoxyphenol hydroxylase-like FAD-dependent oxidoreductase